MPPKSSGCRSAGHRPVAGPWEQQRLQTLLCFVNNMVNVVDRSNDFHELGYLAPFPLSPEFTEESKLPQNHAEEMCYQEAGSKGPQWGSGCSSGIGPQDHGVWSIFFLGGGVPCEVLSLSHKLYVEAEIHPPIVEDLGTQLEESLATFHRSLEYLVQGLQKEAKDKFKEWVACSSADNTDLAFKKVGVRLPLRLWKASVEMVALLLVVLIMCLGSTTCGMRIWCSGRW